MDASIIGAHLRRAQEALYRGIKGPTSHLVNERSLNWIVEGLRRVPRRIGGPHHWVLRYEAGSDPRGHLWVTWGVYLCAGKPPLADIILSHPPDLTRCDSVIGLAIPAMSGHIQYRGAASGDLYIGISGINRVLLS